MNLLFWNVQKKALDKEALNIANEFNVDILFFAEGELINEKTFSDSGFSEIRTLSNIRAFSKYVGLVSPVRESPRYSMLLLDTPVSGKVLLCCMHLVSKINANESDQLVEASLSMAEIVQKREELKISHLIICGDLNMNPYEPALVAAGAFNSTLDRKIAKKMQRTVGGRKFGYFYNPMWRFLGSDSRPYGTHFFRSSKQTAYNWNILDHFLISGSLVDAVADDDVQIIKHTSKFSFVRRDGMIDFKKYSDHLPIFLSANI